MLLDFIVMCLICCHEISYNSTVEVIFSQFFLLITFCFSIHFVRSDWFHFGDLKTMQGVYFAANEDFIIGFKYLNRISKLYILKHSSYCSHNVSTGTSHINNSLKYIVNRNMPI